VTGETQAQQLIDTPRATTTCPLLDKSGHGLHAPPDGGGGLATPASSLRRFSRLTAFIFARVFDGKVALLAMSSGGLGGHGGVAFPIGDENLSYPSTFHRHGRLRAIKRTNIFPTGSD
jgi:hypothetical protein